MIFIFVTSLFSQDLEYFLDLLLLFLFSVLLYFHGVEHFLEILTVILHWFTIRLLIFFEMTKLITFI